MADVFNTDDIDEQIKNVQDNIADAKADKKEQLAEYDEQIADQKETNAKNSKAVIVYRFIGFLMLYLFIFDFLFCGATVLLDIITLGNGVFYQLFYSSLFIKGLMDFCFLFPVFFIFFVLSFIINRPFRCNISKIGFFHLSILIVSFFCCFFLFFACLFLDVFYGKETFVQDLISENFANLKRVFMMLLTIFCIALACKSTFRKHLFMKKD